MVGAVGIEPTSEAWEVLEFTMRVISRTVLCGGRSAMDVSTATQREKRPMYSPWASMWPCMARSTSLFVAPGIRFSLASRA